MDDTRDENMITRYERAGLMKQGIFNKKYCLNGILIPTWFPCGEKFWYRRETRQCDEFRIVDVSTRKNTLAFDLKVLANLLSEAANVKVGPEELRLKDVDISLQPLTVSFSALDQMWVCNIQERNCLKKDLSLSSQLVSPCGSYLAGIKDFNIHLTDNDKGRIKYLTDDGSENNAYGAVGTCWGNPITSPDEPQMIWSPDSTKLFCIQLDKRNVGSLPVVQHVPSNESIRPKLRSVRISYPGDEHIEMLDLMSIDIKTGKITRSGYGPIPVTRNSQGFFAAGLGWWSNDSRCCFFVHMARDYKTASIVEFNVESGDCRVVFKEESNTQINLASNADQMPLLQPLLDTDELVWYSERSGWGHLYLYDLKTGDLKQTITSGDWLVKNITHYDSSNRQLFIQTCGRDIGRDPYYHDLARVSIDTGEITTLFSDNVDCVVFSHRNHSTRFISMIRDVHPDACSISPNGAYSVVTSSRADQIPESFLVDETGLVIMPVEFADVSEFNMIFDNGWEYPEPVKMVAADGFTEIFGLVYRPSDFHADKSYPVIDFMICLPDFPGVPKGSFNTGTLLDWPYLSAMALSELGFIVVQIDGRGVSGRSKAFQDESYGRTYFSNNIDDHVSGIKQLCERFPYMDVDRVGISTHVTDGPGAVLGLLRHPEFYKVGVNFGLFDHRLMPSSMWDHKYGGVSCEAEESFHLEDLVCKLKGKLFLMHGMLDLSCPPAAAFRMAEAFSLANIDFDMLLLPNVGHDDPSDYMIRRSWDYFVTHLMGVTPPREFKLDSFFGPPMKIG